MKHFALETFAFIALIVMTMGTPAAAWDGRGDQADADPPVSDQDDGSFPDGGTGCTGDCGDNLPDGEIDQDPPVNDQDQPDADPPAPDPEPGDGGALDYGRG